MRKTTIVVPMTLIIPSSYEIKIDANARTPNLEAGK